jgi:hypothetical protein
MYNIITLPDNYRRYYNHLLDLMTTTINSTHLGPWAARYAGLIGQDWSGVVNYLQQRANFIRSTMPLNTPFAITTHAGSGFATSNNPVSLTGTAPLTVKDIQINGVSYAITWLSLTNWTLAVPLLNRSNLLTIQGIDNYGAPVAIASASITVTNLGAAGNFGGGSYIGYSVPGFVYSQDFNTLPNPGANSVNTDNPVTINGITYALANPFDFAAAPGASGGTGGLGLPALAGWYGLAGGASRFGATDGDLTAGGQLSFGPAGSSNRALGLLATSTTLSTSFGARFLNTGAATFNQISLQCTGEIWRQSDKAKSLKVYYFIDPTGTNAFPTNATALLPGLDVGFPTVAADVGGVAVDGTAAANQVSLGIVNQPIAAWPTGAALWLVWEMADSAGKAQGLAIDNLSFSALTQAASPPVPLEFELTGQSLVISWPSLANQTYQIEYKDNLRETNWTVLGNVLSGTGGTLMTTNDVTSSAQKFFRLHVGP